MALKMRNTGGAMDAPEAGTYLARVVGMVDLDLQDGYLYQGEKKPAKYKVTFTYELPNSRTSEDKPHWVSEDLNISDHEKSTMYKRVRALDPQGTISNKGADMAKLISAPCLIEVTLSDKGWPRIENVSPVMGGIEVPELENTPFVFDWDNPDIEVFKRLPEFVQKKLKGGLNYSGSKLHEAIIMSGGDDSDGPDV